MNANVILVIGLVLITVAILAFILLVLLPAKGEKDVIFRGWMVADEDEIVYVCTEFPRRQTWIDSEGHVHGIWWHDDAEFLEVGGLLLPGLYDRVDPLPTWDDEPVRIELVLRRDVNDGLVPSEMMEDEQLYEV